MTEGTIRIDIIDDTSRRDCDAACGEDWSSQAAIDLASHQIKNRFGTEARLEYLDLSRATTDSQTAQWCQMIKDKNLSVPLLLINGRLRVAGRFDTRQMMDAVEAEMDIGT